MTNFRGFISFCYCFLFSIILRGGELPENKRLSRDAFFFEGVKEFQLGNADGALSQFERAIGEDPSFDVGYYYLALIHEKKGNMPLSLSLFEKAHDLAPERYFYHEALAQHLVKTRKFEKGAAVFEEVAKKHPKRLNHYRDAGYYYTLTQKYAEATRVYLLLEKKQGVTEETSVALEHVYLSWKKPEKALKQMKKLSTTYPNDSRYKGMLADLLIDMGKQGEAFQLYQEILKMEPGNGLAHFSMADLYSSRANSHDLFAFHLMMAFRDPKVTAEKKLPSMYDGTRTPGWKIPPGLTDSLLHILLEVHPDEAAVWVLKGDLLMQQGKLKLAAEAYLTAARMGKNHPVYYRKLLETAKVIDHPDKTNWAREALSSAPEYEWFHLMYINFLLESKSYQEVIRQGLLSTDLFPNQPELMADLLSFVGEAAHFLKQYSLSDSVYEIALTLMPSSPQILNNYAYFLSLRKEKLDKALTFASRTLNGDPHNAGYNDTYGWVLFQMGKEKEAEIYIKKSWELEKSVEVGEHLIEVYQKLGNTEAAKQVEAEIIKLKLNVK